jgi:hypothetical protein
VCVCHIRYSSSKGKLGMQVANFTEQFGTLQAELDAQKGDQDMNGVTINMDTLMKELRQLSEGMTLTNCQQPSPRKTC